VCSSKHNQKACHAPHFPTPAQVCWEPARCDGKAGASTGWLGGSAGPNSRVWHAALPVVPVCLNGHACAPPWLEPCQCGTQGSSAPRASAAFLSECRQISISFADCQRSNENGPLKGHCWMSFWCFL
jgi:hypothetical protein